MLLMFKVKNYTSFKEESVLDLRATSYVQHQGHCIKATDKINLLKTNAIYGANASGKSNFISAMFFFEQYIFSQFISKKESFDNDEDEQVKVKLEPFLLSKTKDDASEFDIIFISNGKQIQYGFECTAKEVVNEWYFIDGKKVFERQGTKVTFGTGYQKSLRDYKKIPAERLYLSVLEYFLDDETKNEILGFFISFFMEEFDVYTELLFESSVKGLADFFRSHKKLVENKRFRKKVEKYLKQIDVGIKGIDIQEETVLNSKTGKEKTNQIIKTIHDVYDDNGNIIGEEYFDLKQESTGTLRFFAYIQNIIELIERGGVFIIDELSARLHPKLTKLIVDIFQSEVNDKAQLIFTTHDISLLNNNQFRRDEVVFVDKNERGESKIVTLSDLKVRDDATFSKDYMSGKYGAVPIFDYDKLLSGDRL